jgi:predicted glycosyltransferase involved in capsule biosynthesis
MQNLDNLTIIIPVYIDTEDRLNNAKTVLGYINNWLETSVIIHELVDTETKLDFLNDFKNLKIKHIVEKRDGKNYHKTRQLNEMLNLVDTYVTCSYDIDVILDINSYVNSVKEIENNNYEVIYPYGWGNYQKRVFKSFNRSEFNEKYDISLINNNFDIYSSRVGHCCFMKTESYKQCGGENEYFMAYGPEDVERFERFQKFGFSVGRLTDYVYHFEHIRKEFSDYSNPDIQNNDKLLNEIRKMSTEELISYYKEIDYRKKYNF